MSKKALMSTILKMEPGSRIDLADAVEVYMLTPKEVEDIFIKKDEVEDAGQYYGTVESGFFASR